jgi:hypothetical protein
MIYNKNLALAILIFMANACYSETKNELDLSEYSEVFIQSYNNIKNNEPNFNNNMYIFDYSCGGGALCAIVYDPSSSSTIDFPDEYMMENEGKEISFKYKKDSDVICVTGFSAYDLTYYDNICYKLLNSKLIDIK